MPSIESDADSQGEKAAKLKIKLQDNKNVTTLPSGYSYGNLKIGNVFASKSQNKGVTF